MAINPKQIGWSVTSNLLHQLQKKLAGQNGNVSQEIGWSTENKLVYDNVEAAACSPCNGIETTTTTSTTTTSSTTTTTTTLPV